MAAAEGAAAGNKRPESVLVVVHTVGGLVLLMERADRQGFWQSVTGSLEHDEDPDAAAARELVEETGLCAAPDATGVERVYEIYEHWRHRYPEGVTHNREYEYRLKLTSPVDVQLQPREHVRYEWVPISEAAERVFSWTNREALEVLLEG
ncbi:MAG: dihydroneopterin triphosphate diphosphatase [Pseudomonadota bacterium]